MSRKTFDIKDLVEIVNRRLEVKDSTLNLADMPVEQVFRLAACSLLEEILHSTDNYAGFKYQSDQFTVEPWELKPNYDSTRRNYYTKDGL